MASSIQNQSSIVSSACAAARVPVPTLPWDIMQVLAENSDDILLMTLSNTSSDLRKICCHEINKRSYKTLELAFQNDSLPTASLMDCYRNFMMDDVTTSFVDQNTMNSVKTNLQAFVTNVISKGLLKTKESLRQAIEQRKCTFPKIQKEYKTLESSYVFRGIELVISSCRFDDQQWELRSCAVIKAIQQNEPALARMILKNGPSHDSLGDIMIKAAASKGYADIIGFLFEDLDPAFWDPELMEEALNEAIQSHQNEAVRILILNWDYSNKILENALKTALNLENKSMISLILSCCEFSDESLEAVIMQLLDENHAKYIPLILEDLETNFELTNFALSAAISKNCLQLCEHIIQQHPIQPEDLKNAFNQAVTNKCEDIVQVFLQTGKITKSVIQSAQEKLKSAEDKRMLEILSDHMLIFYPL